MKIITDLQSWFDSNVTLSCSEFTKAYLINLLSKPNKIDISSESIVLTHIEALSKNSFELHQKIGDWSCFALSQNFKPQFRETYTMIGQSSYRSCHNILNRQWALYEELSENLPKITNEIRIALKVQE